jgi:hypothetical protein
MGAFDAIKRAEEFGKTYAQKRDILAVAHTQGEYDDEPSMKTGRYDETGRRRDGRKRIQGFSASQRFTSQAGRDKDRQTDMNLLRVRNQPYRKQIGRQGGKASHNNGIGQ